MAYDSEAQLREALERWQQRSQRNGRRASQRVGGSARQRRDHEQPGVRRRQEHGGAGTAAVAQAAADESITNVQHGGVDEGGIVKRARRPPRRAAARPPVHGARRRRRAAAGRRCRRLSAPGSRPGGRLVRRDADLRQHDRRDRLQLRARRHRDRPVRASRRRARSRYSATYHLRSNDYYSSRNYASRLIGRQAGLLHADSACSPGAPSRAQQFPAMREWQRGRDAAGLPAHRAGHAHLPHRRRVRPASRWRCTRVTVCDLGERRAAIASPPRCSGPPGACSTCRTARSTCGRRSGGASRDAERGRAARCRRVPHPARRQRADRAEDRRASDRPVLLPRGRDGHLNVLLRANGPRRGHVGQRAHGRRDGAAARAARRLRRRPRRGAGASTTAACRRRRRRRCRTASSATGCLWGGAAVAASPRPTPGRCVSAGAEAPRAGARPRGRAHRGARRDAVVVGNARQRSAFHRLRLARGEAADRPAATCSPASRRAKRAATASSTVRRTTTWAARPAGARAARAARPRRVHRQRRARRRCCSCATAACASRRWASCARGDDAARATTAARPLRRLVRQRAADLPRRSGASR